MGRGPTDTAAPLAEVRFLLGARAATDLVSTAAYYVMLQRLSDTLMEAKI